MSEKETQPFSEKERAVIGEMFKKRKNRHDVGELTRILYNISRQLGRINLLEIHEILRVQVSNIYFIARPTEESTIMVSAWPHSGERKYKYRLYICTGGERQYTHWLKTENMTHEENLERLNDTGLFMLRPGTERARMANAKLN